MLVKKDDKDAKDLGANSKPGNVGKNIRGFRGKTLSRVGVEIRNIAAWTQEIILSGGFWYRKRNTEL